MEKIKQDKLPKHSLVREMLFSIRDINTLVYELERRRNETNKRLKALKKTRDRIYDSIRRTNEEE